MTEQIEKLQRRVEELEALLYRRETTLNFPKEWRLTAKEHGVLTLLITSNVQYISKEEILDALYGMDKTGTKIIDVFICKIRNKLKRGGADWVHIDTYWGKGYGIDTEIRKQVLNVCDETNQKIADFTESIQAVA